MKCEGNEERHNVPQGRVVLPDIIIMKEGVGGQSELYYTSEHIIIMYRLHTKGEVAQ